MTPGPGAFDHHSSVLAIDIGGTSMKGSVVIANGSTIISITKATPTRDILSALLALIDELMAAASDLGHTVVAAGVVMPGMVNEAAGIVLYASNLHWRNVPLLQILTTKLGIPVAIGHDVRAAGLAEHLLGVARGFDDFVLVPIGTGVAAALVTSGNTITGATSAAGEFGHIPVVPGGELCACGQLGCLEVYASGAGLSRRYKARGGETLSSAEIVARLDTDAIADEVWGDAIRVLAQGLTIMTLLMDPGVIVLGGGFSQAGTVLLEPLTTAMTASLAWRDVPRVELSVLGGDGGRIGAAMLAYRAAGLGTVVNEWSVIALHR